FALLSVVFTAVQVIGMGIGGVWAESVGSTGPPLIGAAIAMVIVSLIGFAAISRFKLHSLLPQKQKESVEEESVILEEDHA
ncbi:MAG: hypothetical protein KAU48_11455, partial [Candidatus Thorarchaeota archaeon]|nr:hypothetical protein [Candidatus Thorarchaeota archaeon]